MHESAIVDAGGWPRSAATRPDHQPAGPPLRADQVPVLVGAVELGAPDLVYKSPLQQGGRFRGPLQRVFWSELLV